MIAEVGDSQDLKAYLAQDKCVQSGKPNMMAGWLASIWAIPIFLRVHTKSMLNASAGLVVLKHAEVRNSNRASPWKWAVPKM